MDLDRAILNHSARIGRRIDRTEAIRGLARLFVTDPEVAERAIQAAVELAHDGRNGGRQAEPDRGLDKGEPDTGLGF